MAKILRSSELLTLIMLIVVIEQTACWSTGRDLLFDKIGELGFKQYFVPKNIKGYWHESRRLCEEFGMEFARLELASEATYIFGVLANYGPAAYQLYVDGYATVPGQKTGWYWVRNRYPIDYAMVFGANKPNNVGGDELCLSVEKLNGVVAYNDVPCYSSATAVMGGPRAFICQIKHENFIHRVINSQGGK